MRVFSEEAARVCDILLASGARSPLLNLGSSTRVFREVTQPHIDARLFAPLRAAGIETFHCDLKPGDGIDLSGDILDPAVTADLRRRGFGTVLVANVLEHVRDRAAVARACEEIVGPGGAILATVPASYPYHADPIDTGYRPTPRELAALFRDSEIALAEELELQTYSDDIRERGAIILGEVARTALSALLLRPRSVRAQLDRWWWYARPYRVSIALVTVR